MKKILIVSPSEPTGSKFQQLLSESGFYTAGANGGRTMVEFCQQHSPDLIILDVDASDDIWFSVQAIRTIRDLGNLPVLGISKEGPRETLERAKEFGFCGLMPKDTDPETIINSIHTIMTEAQENNQAAMSPVGLSRLREISAEVDTVATTLANNVPEFGADGPELFNYIRTSSQDIANKLGTISESDLADKELRHDFRNMIGSVTGFSELILMEPTLSPASQTGLTRLRECSKEFVELLDQQKAAVV